MKTLPFAFALLALFAGARPAHAECSDTAVCSGGPVRIMFVVDGSSALLNGGTGPAPMGTSDWDLMRDVLAVDEGPPGDESIFSAVVDTASDIVISQIAHVGLISFGDPGQEVRVIDYAPCARDNLEWALDPRTSCDSPGCTDPWGGPPIEWTFKDGSEIDPPDFVRETLSTMPRCDQSSGDLCSGSGRAVHSGIAFATSNQAAYESQTGYTHDAGTLYVNILLVTDTYAPSSTDAQVQEALEAAVAAGITTHVVAFGAGAEAPSAEFAAQLDDMATWGGSGTPRTVTSGPELHAAIQQIVAGLALPCCYTIDCSGAGGADGGGIGNDDGDDAGTDDAADGGEWGSIDGDGSASAEGGDATADASDSDSDSDGNEAGFDDDGGCRCSSGGGGAAWWLVVFGVIGRRRRSATSAS